MWSRIRIKVGKKGPQKSEEMHCFEVLDVLFRGLERLLLYNEGPRDK
jgi:hypothetical protein